MGVEAGAYGSIFQVQKKVHCRRAPAPAYRCGQKVWWSSRDLPLLTKSRKLALWFVGPFKVDWMVKAEADRLKLLASLSLHPTFHILWVKPAGESELAPVADDLPLA